MEKDHSPWIIAHRGDREQTPENTFTALNQALTYPVDGLEFDVQMSADHVPILYHDHTLRKVGGGGKRVSHLPLRELEKVDWGKWFDDRFSGEPVTPLTKVLTLADRCHHMCVEIKSNAVDRASGHVGRLTSKVLDLIDQPAVRPFKKHILILSFDSDVLIQGHGAAPDLRYVLNISEAVPTDPEIDTRHLWAVGVEIGKLSESSAHWVRKHDLHLFTYTCNGPEQLKKAVQLGVDAIITDRPGWLCRQLGRESPEVSG